MVVTEAKTTVHGYDVQCDFVQYLDDAPQGSDELDYSHAGGVVVDIVGNIVQCLA